MNETTWFWIGTAGMAAGAALLTALGKKRTQDEVGFSKADADGDLERAEVTAMPVTTHGVAGDAGPAPRP